MIWGLIEVNRITESRRRTTVSEHPANQTVYLSCHKLKIAKWHILTFSVLRLDGEEDEVGTDIYISSHSWGAVKWWRGRPRSSIYISSCRHLVKTVSAKEKEMSRQKKKRYAFIFHHASAHLVKKTGKQKRNGQPKLIGHSWDRGTYAWGIFLDKDKKRKREWHTSIFQQNKVNKVGDNRWVLVWTHQVHFQWRRRDGEVQWRAKAHLKADNCLYECRHMAFIEIH